MNDDIQTNDDVTVRVCLGIEVIFLFEKGIQIMSAKSNIKDLKKMKDIASHYACDQYLTTIKVDKDQVFLTGKNLKIN